jgi:hypothetical protein
LSVVVAVILPHVTARPHRSPRIASAAALIIRTQRFWSIAINPISHRLRSFFVFMGAAWSGGPLSTTHSVVGYYDRLTMLSQLGLAPAAQA